MQRSVMLRILGAFFLSACGVVWLTSMSVGARAAETPDNAAAAALRRYAAAGLVWLWPAGMTLEGCFITGTVDERKLVADGAAVWMTHANIVFDFGAAPAYRDCPPSAPFPHVRVTFGVGSASRARIGSLALNRPNEKPTMFLANTLPNKRQIPVDNMRATILHELGHILGLVHEHQHPESACFHMVAWTALCAKREATRRLPVYLVTNWLPTIGQVNAPYAAGRPYDPTSIMHYKILDRNLTGPATTCTGQRNTTLSEGDIAKIGLFYPKSRADQLALIRLQAPFIARAILSTTEFDQAAAERVAREGERIVRRAFDDLQDFKIDLSAAVSKLKPGRTDRGGLALAGFGTGAVEAAAAACAKAEAPPAADTMLQIRRGAH